MSKKLTIEKMQKIARRRGGECLSSVYINNKTKLKWRCEKGHEWEAIPDRIKRGSWCPFCAHRAPLSIKDMQEIAREKRGNCLSEEYVNAHTKLKWRCKKGHEWEAMPLNIRKGHWCPYCTGRYRTIDDMQRMAKDKEGECLSKEFVNMNTKVKWRCQYGHEWDTTPSKIKSGQWCPICAGIDRLTIEEMQEIARERKGKCVSKKYKNAHTALTWQCELGHTWNAKPNDVKYGNQWCPKCSPGISERICRRTFELIFHSDFPKFKPNWLVNPNGNKMELDGYNKKLGIAFEYQGRQHYRFVKRFHQSEEGFLQRKQDDDLKRTLCKQNKVILIEIPYSIEKEEIANYVMKKCKKNGIKIPPQASLSTFDYRTFDGIYSPENLKEMQEIAKERGGECLSTEYITARTKLRWKCNKDGYKWEATPDNVKHGKWCPYCAHKAKLTLKEMQEIARKRGGECLSTKYVDSKTKMRWRCSQNHEWENTPGHVKAGQWCPYCAGTVKLTIEEMWEIAKKKGGECLSKKYIDGKTKLKWRCKEGHEWEAIPNSIKRGSWCSICSRTKRGLNRRLTIEEMQDIARQRGGVCLSTEYINNHTKLRWRCKEGHIWNATPGHIKRGEWCPICFKNKKK